MLNVTLVWNNFFTKGFWQYIALFDDLGNFLEGLIWGTPSEANTPPNTESTDGGLIELAPVCDNTSVIIPPASEFASFEMEPDDT